MSKSNQKHSIWTVATIYMEQRSILTTDSSPQAGPAAARERHLAFAAL